MHNVKVPFRDVDMHGHVHNSAYVCYFEEAITGWLEHNEFISIDNPIVDDFQFFIKKIEVIYHQPAHFNKQYQIDVVISKIGNTSVTFTCAMYLMRSGERSLIAEENAVWVSVDDKGNSTMINPSLRAKLEKLVSGGE